MHILRKLHSFSTTAPKTTNRPCIVQIRRHSSTNSTFRHQKDQQQLVSLLYKHPTSRHGQQVHSQLITTCSTYLPLYNAVLRCYSHGGFYQETFVFFREFQRVFYLSSFDSYTFSIILNACGNLQCSIAGTQIHVVTTKLGFESHVYVQTALILLYGVCGFLVEAHKMFDEMPVKSYVTWNVMITNLVKWNEVALACSLFDKMPNRTVVSWTAIVDGYTRMNRVDEALHMFQKMIVQEDIKPSEITILSILPAIWKKGAINMCQSIHCYCEKCGFNVFDIRVANSLIDSYAKCGCIESASRFFMEIPDKRKNLVSWTSIISGYAMHGMGKEAVENFQWMEESGLKPNRVTFLSVLNACSHGGLVDEGVEFFKKMVKESQVKPDVKHYGCLVDMLGRAGRLKEAEEMALEVPDEMANVVIWRTLLGACSLHGDVEMGERVTERILVMERGYGGDYVLMSNILARAGRYGDAEKLRGMMDDSSAYKVPGHSMA